jgi:hypothetical protein
VQHVCTFPFQETIIMARIQPLTKSGSSRVSRLRVFPEQPGQHTGIPDASDQLYTTFLNGGGFTGPSSANTASSTSSSQVMDVVCMGPVYTPTANNAPSIASGSFGLVDFDGGTVAQFPLRPNDLIFIGTQANWAPIAGNGEAYVYADPLNALGLICMGVKVVGASSGTACRIQAVVLNTTGASVTVPSTWLPNLMLVRVGVATD